ncbi:hypothetical protein BBOV_II000325 [Babesia bovis T2Bo]|uniref:hypothetical protein n=1 Tax=Babesia bovis T2Bo TaxID=484906 RepID=UPI001C36460D|nr:hypothetical protein BBOV_II000325 [Babesia bovis T2Bo]KAG6440179.1 hypothetical protein BBOV_II000325 [Babesia bovis T2Bo]
MDDILVRQATVGITTEDIQNHCKKHRYCGLFPLRRHDYSYNRPIFLNLHSQFSPHLPIKAKIYNLDIILV